MVNSFGAAAFEGLDLPAFATMDGIFGWVPVTGEGLRAEGNTDPRMRATAGKPVRIVFVDLVDLGRRGWIFLAALGLGVMMVSSSFQ
jgi:hypothetical protein